MHSAQSRDSEGVLIASAGYAATERRYQSTTHNNKTLMDCFRDRGSSHKRAIQIETASGKPDAILICKDRRIRPNKLTLLRSTSARDLSRLLEEEGFISTPNLAIDITPSTQQNQSRSPALINNSTKTLQQPNFNDNKFIEMEKRISILEEDLLFEKCHTKELESKILELTKKVEQLATNQQLLQPPEKTKKKSGIYCNAKGGENVTVHPSKLKAWINLSNFWKQRPSIQSLKEQNIYNDEPCFDTEIEMVLKHEIHKNVPKIIVDCCDLIEEKFRKSPEPIEGIVYRQCGDYNKIQTLRFKIDSNDYAILRSPKYDDVHTLAGLLKLFLREIKSPLISPNEAKTFIGKPNQWILSTITAKKEALKRLIRSLPEINRDTLQYLFKHFNRLTKIPLQQISSETLAISVAPSVFQAVQPGSNLVDLQELIKENEMLSDCINVMIKYHNDIF